MKLINRRKTESGSACAPGVGRLTPRRPRPTRIAAWLAIALLGVISTGTTPWGVAEEPEPPQDGSWKDKIVVIHLRDADLGDGRSFGNVRSILDKATADEAMGLIWKLHLSSTDVEQAMDHAQTLAQVDLPSIAWVAPSALGGGAAVALAADRIFMAPGALLGAAAPEYPSSSDLSEAAQEQMFRRSLSLMKAKIESLAERKGHSPAVALAFVDATRQLEHGEHTVVEQGDILILSANQAMLPDANGKTLLASGISADLTDLLRQADWSGHEVVELRPDQYTRMAQDRRRQERATLAVERKGSTEESTETDETTADPATAKEEEERPYWRTREQPFTGQVVIIEVGMHDLISPARFKFMQRMLERASREQAEAVIFDIDTPGGLVWDTTTLIMEDLQKVTVPTFAFVNPRALSAGAMVSIGTDAIYMSPAGTIGAATPVYGDGGGMDEATRAKMNSAVMGMARAAARAKGYRWELIEAMIDKDRELIIDGQVLCAVGEILTLDATEATMVIDGQPLLAKAIVANLNELAALEGLQGELVVAQPLAMETFAHMVATYAAVLILIGVVGAYMEMQTPGFGVPGFVAVAAFAVFFFGHSVAGSLVTYEALVVFILGAVLIIAELLFFPGLLIGAVPGFLMMCGALIYVMAGMDINIPEGKNFPTQLSSFAVPLRNLMLGLVGAALTIAALARWLPETKMFRRFILATSIGGQPDLATPEGVVMRESWANDGTSHGDAGAVGAILAPVGATGKTLSTLRPYGSALINGRNVEVVSEDGIIPPGTEIKVIDRRGVEVVVSPAGQEHDNQS